jgi:hypothetical protein
LLLEVVRRMIRIAKGVRCHISPWHAGNSVAKIVSTDV